MIEIEGSLTNVSIDYFPLYCVEKRRVYFINCAIYFAHWQPSLVMDTVSVARFFFFFYAHRVHHNKSPDEIQAGRKRRKRRCRQVKRTACLLVFCVNFAPNCWPPSGCLMAN